MTAGMPRECARMAAWDVRVPSSLTRPTTCSRSSCTVRPGDSSRVTTMTCSSGAIAQTSSSVRPRSRCSMRIWMACRSARRSRSRALGELDQRFRTSSALNSYAVSALSALLRMSCSTDWMKYSSFAISICASKMRDSSGPARSCTRWPSSRSAVTTASTASRSRRTSSSTWDAGTARSGTSGKSSRITSAGPKATPGDTPTPRSTCGAAMVTSPRSRRPPGP
jgi:hypothetical protein